MTSYTEFLYRALEAKVGIVIATSDPKLLQQKLYAARREASNPEFAGLTFAPSRTSPQTELWIVKKVHLNGSSPK